MIRSKFSPQIINWIKKSMSTESLIFTTGCRNIVLYSLHPFVSLINHHVIIILPLLLDTGENKKKGEGKKGKKICLSSRTYSFVLHQTNDIETIRHRDSIYPFR